MGKPDAHRIVTQLNAANGTQCEGLAGDADRVRLGDAMRAAVRLGISGSSLFDVGHRSVPEFAGVLDLERLCKRDVLRDR